MHIVKTLHPKNTKVASWIIFVFSLTSMVILYPSQQSSTIVQALFVFCSVTGVLLVLPLFGFGTLHVAKQGLKYRGVTGSRFIGWSEVKNFKILDGDGRPVGVICSTVSQKNLVLTHNYGITFSELVDMLTAFKQRYTSDPPKNLEMH